MLKEECLHNSKYILHYEIWSAQDSENAQIMVFRGVHCTWRQVEGPN